MYRKKIIVFILLLFVFNLYLYSSAQAATPIELFSETETETFLELNWIGDLPAPDNYVYSYRGDYWSGDINMNYQDPDPNSWSLSFMFSHTVNPHGEIYGNGVEGNGIFYNDGLDSIILEDSEQHGFSGHYDMAFFIVTRDDLDPDGWTDIVVTIQHGSPPVVPEPVSSVLFLIGGATLGFRRFRKKL